jgi:hypothetical protein
MNPRRKRDVEFSDGTDIRSEPFLTDQAKERPVGVRLDGVKRHVRVPLEGTLDVAAVIEDRAFAVHIERGAEFFRDSAQWD